MHNPTYMISTNGRLSVMPGLCGRARCPSQQKWRAASSTAPRRVRGALRVPDSKDAKNSTPPRRSLGTAIVLRDSERDLEICRGCHSPTSLLCQLCSRTLRYAIDFKRRMPERLPMPSLNWLHCSCTFEVGCTADPRKTSRRGTELPVRTVCSKVGRYLSTSIQLQDTGGV